MVSPFPYQSCKLCYPALFQMFRALFQMHWIRSGEHGTYTAVGRGWIANYTNKLTPKTKRGGRKAMKKKPRKGTEWERDAQGSVPQKCLSRNLEAARWGMEFQTESSQDKEDKAGGSPDISLVSASSTLALQCEGCHRKPGKLDWPPWLRGQWAKRGGYRGTPLS